MKRIPNPVITEPIPLTLRLLKNKHMKTPTTAKTGATTPTLIAIICAVIVVPILEPITTQIHLFNVIKLAFMKPINITVTAEELCTAAVTPIPTRTPLNFVFVSFSKIVFKRSPAASSKESLKTCIPYKKSASPPNKSSQFVIFIISFSFFYHYIITCLYVNVVN